VRAVVLISLICQVQAGLPAPRSPQRARVQKTRRPDSSRIRVCFCGEQTVSRHCPPDSEGWRCVCFQARREDFHQQVNHLFGSRTVGIEIRIVRQITSARGWVAGQKQTAPCAHRRVAGHLEAERFAARKSSPAITSRSRCSTNSWLRACTLSRVRSAAGPAPMRACFRPKASQ